MKTQTKTARKRIALGSARQQTKGSLGINLEADLVRPFV